MKHQTQVLIIGAGPVGLALAIELGQRGIDCLVLEKHASIGVAPRAKTTNVRSREHFRRWGIADKLRDAAPFGIHYPPSVIFTTKLSGYKLAQFDNAFYGSPGKNPLYSEHSQWIPQYKVERVMRAHLDSLPSVQVALNMALERIEQDSDSSSEAPVTATVRHLETGIQSTIAADYLVGCDGASSFVRGAIGAKMEGVFGMSRNYNIVFRAPGLAAAHPHGAGIMYWQVNKDVPSFMGPMDDDDRWFFMPTGLAPDVVVTLETAPDMIRKATGIDLPYEALSVDEWTAHQAVATHYRDRRVFLAGDACHLHPPFGGFGMNMGISDSVDLGWKLAAVLQGWGGEKLLDSYEPERRPVHQHVLKEASKNHSQLSGGLYKAGMEDDTDAGAAIRERVGKRIEAVKLSEFYTLGTMLGDRYADSPVVQSLGQLEAAIGESIPSPPRDFLNFIPNALPGSRAPHAWLHDGSSLFDHFGMGFTLIAQGEHRAEHHAEQDAARLGIPLTVLQAPHPIFDTPAIASLYSRCFTLIRPDQHIAWTGDVWPDSRDEDVLAFVTGQL